MTRLFKHYQASFKLSRNVIVLSVLIITSLGMSQSFAQQVPRSPVLDTLKNYQVNSPTMVSAGLPEPEHFKALKDIGVSKVIDLIPGDRSEEISLMQALELPYYNVQVEWEQPTLQNFSDYVVYMNASEGSQGITLTHCRLNWRGAVFTYLYRVTQLQEDEALAKKDMLAIWRPNKTWQAYIDEVKAFYKVN